MISPLFNGSIALAVAFSFFLQTSPTTKPQETKSFDIAISLPSSAIHEGEEIVVDTTFSNPTDHEIHVGEGSNGGVAMELIGANGTDIGRHAMGDYQKDQEDLPVIATTRQTFRPGYKRKFTIRWKPDPGYVVPGTYRLRVYRRDLEANRDVYSNAVTLTVIR